MYLIIKVRDKREEEELLSALSRLGFYWKLKEEKPADQHFPSIYSDFPYFLLLTGKRLAWSSVLSRLPHKEVNLTEAQNLLAYPNLTLEILYQEANLHLRKGERYGEQR